MFVVATANNVKELPPELLRKGRFDEIFFVDLPTLNEREEIFRIHISKPREEHGGRNIEDFDLHKLASKSEGFSGAEIEQIVIAALFTAFKNNEELQQKHIMSAISESVPLSKTMKEQINYLRQWVQGRARFASSELEGHSNLDRFSSIASDMPKLKVVKKRREDDEG